MIYSNDDDFGLNGSVAKTIPGSYPIGNLAATAVAGQINDYGQLLEVDPTKLQADLGFVTVMVSVAGNVPPTISDVTNKTTAVNTTTTAIPVTIGDAETVTSALIMTATSSNPALVPATGIALGGSGANRTITLTPLTLQVGTSTITLTVTDGQGISTSDTFVLTVGNNAPIALPGSVIVAAGTTGSGSVTATDTDGPSALIYSVVSPPTQGTVTITPATGAFSYIANATASGVDSFTFKANDGLSDSNVATEAVTFPVPVTPPVETDLTSSSGCGVGSGLAALFSLTLCLTLRLRSRT